MTPPETAEKTVAVETRGAVRIIRMQSGADNRFNPDFIRDMNEALDAVLADEAAAAAVLASAREKFFSNGIDIEWVMKNGYDALQEFFPALLRMLDRLLMFPKPVVAAINGHAFAGGFFLAMTADQRVMRAGRGWCCANEIDLGMPLCNALLSLPSYVAGKRTTQRIVTTGERYDAEACLRMGLADASAPAEELLDAAIKTAEALGSKNAGRYAEFKRDLRAETSRIILHDAEHYVVPAQG